MIGFIVFMGNVFLISDLNFGFTSKLFWIMLMLLMLAVQQAALYKID